MRLNSILNADALSGLKTLPAKSIQCTVTSPPYWGLRSYGTTPISWPAVEYSILGFKVNVPEMSCELGHEEDPKAFIGHMVLIFREVHRVTRDDGTLWLNIGDSYSGSGKGIGDLSTTKQATNKGSRGEDRKAARGLAEYKPKDLIGIPWMLAYALRDDGWYLRQDIIWSKPNPMPESVADRCTKSHEYIFMFSKSRKYYYDAEAIRTALTESAVARLSQDTENQKGSARAFGGLKHNGNMKAVMKKDKQRGHSRRHAGFNERWDQMSKEEQMAGGANKKSVWTVVTQPFSEAHFATFPQELIVDCIKAGSSEHGCCSKCGAPFVRISEKELLPGPKASFNTKPDSRDQGADSQDQGSNRVKDGHKPGWFNQYTTIGWAPTCACENAKVTPCIILDPFMGAGTTAVVSRKLQRNYFGIELNAKYIDITLNRLAKELGMFV